MIEYNGKTWVRLTWYNSQRTNTFLHNVDGYNEWEYIILYHWCCVYVWGRDAKPSSQSWTLEHDIIGNKYVMYAHWRFSLKRQKTNILSTTLWTGRKIKLFAHVVIMIIVISGRGKKTSAHNGNTYVLLGYLNSF